MKLFARILKSKPKTEHPSPWDQRFAYDVSPASLDAELAEATKQISDLIADLLERTYGSMTQENWNDLLKLAALRTAALSERQRRDTYFT